MNVQRLAIMMLVVAFGLAMLPSVRFAPLAHARDDATDDRPRERLQEHDDRARAKDNRPELDRPQRMLDRGDMKKVPEHVGGRMRGKMAGRKPGMRGLQPLSPRDRAQMMETFQKRMAIIEELDPAMAERIKNRLEHAGRGNSDHVAQKLDDHWQQINPRIRQLPELQQRDPEAYEISMNDLRLDRQSQELVKRIRGNRDATDQDRIRLKEMISEHFDVRQRKYDREVERLEARLSQLRQRIQARQERRSEIEDKRFTELVGASDDSNW